jgi:hypothetical protein
MTRTLNTAEVEQRIRHALSSVAATLTEASVESPVPARQPRRPSRRWRIGLGIGAVAIPIALAAGAFYKSGPEYVDTIPPGDIIVTGDVDGSRYLLIKQERTDNCGQPVTTVELLEEKENLLGSEWNTIGNEYGEMTDCWLDTSRYLADPSLYNNHGTVVGDSFVWLFAVHPTVTTVRITSEDYSRDLTVHEVNGAGHAVFEVPGDLGDYTSELLVNGEAVPGSLESHTVPHQ